MLHPTVAASLAELAIAHEVLPCDTELADTAVFCAHYGIRPEDSANTIMVSSKRPAGIDAACVALATTRLDVNNVVRGALAVKKLSFSPPERTSFLTGMELGGVTPFGLPAGLRLLIDARITEHHHVVLGGGNRTSKVVVDGSDLVRLPGAEVIEGLAISI